MKTFQILLALTLLAATPLRGQIVADGATNTLSNVTNTFTGDVIVGTNGLFTLLVLSDNALLTNSANGVIGRNATAKSNEVSLISPSARWRMGGSVFVGSNGASSRLVVSNGALLENLNGNLGFASVSSNNSALITGPGSLWTNRGSFAISGAFFSNSRSNQLVVSDSAALVSETALVSGFRNQALVTGAGSRWSIQSYFEIGGTENQLEFSQGAGLVSGSATIVGGDSAVLLTGSGTAWTNNGSISMGFSSGRALLTASNGSSLFVGGTASIGALSGSNSNRVSVTDPGTTCTIGSNLLVGANSSGNQLAISNGGFVVSSNGILGATLGGSFNSALVTGAGSVWSNRNYLHIGDADRDNQLVVSNGGWLVSSEGHVGRNISATSNKVVLTGVGSGWNNLGTLFLGEDGRGNAMIASNGATMLSSNVFMGTSTNLGHNNLALLTGTGTVWSNQNDFVVGNFSDGNRLVITNGAYVENGSGIIGARISCDSNEVVVTGAGSMWTNSSWLYVGKNGAFNRLAVSDGGQVRSAGCNIGEYIGFFGPTNADNNEAIITGAGSLWQNTFGSLFVGGSRSTGNRLVVSNGASMFNGICYIGFQATNNLVLVTGPGSTLSNNSFVVLGQEGTGNRLLVTNGASVFASFVEVGRFGSASGNLVRVDDGTLQTSGKFDILRGTNVFNSGLMDLGLLLLTSTQGFFEFNGGTLITRGAVISNGTDFAVGASGTNPAVWDVRAGASNHVVTGSVLVGQNTSFNQLLVTNGGVLRDNFGILGVNASSSNNVALLAGSGSVWSNANDVYVGRFGSGNQLIVSSGGVVRNNDGYLGVNSGSSSNLVVVTGLGAVWSNVGALFLGSDGQGNRLVVTNEGVVRSSSGFVGTSSSNNQALVTGAGSSWSNTNELRVGNVGARNSLVVSNGATVSAGTTAYIGFAFTSTNNRITVDGGTLRVTNASVNGTLDVRRGNITLTAGLVEVDRLLLTNTLSQFSLNGGTLSTRSTTVASGIFFHVGNNIGPATMFLAGNGTHVFPSSLQIDDNSTLTGNGTIGGVVLALNSGTISPGASIGKMIFTNSPFLLGRVFMEISKNGAVLTNDQIQVMAPLTYGHDLIVTNLGPSPLAAGDKFQLFSATSYAGSFSSLTLPPLPAPLSWTNKLLVDGSIEVFAPPAIALSSGSYTQSFDSLSLSGGSNPWRDNSTLLGWYAAKTVAPNGITNYMASDGSSGAGSLYSFGSTGSGERALGSVASGTPGDIGYGLAFTNDTGGSVSNFVITYTGEQWRNGGGSANTLTFWYRVSPTVITSSELAALTNWTEVTNLNFAAPSAVTPTGFSLDGNLTTNRQVFSSVLVSGLTAPPGQNVFFRWHDVDSTGTDQGMAVDDFIVSFIGPSADRFWTNALGGDYHVAVNWLSNTVPLFHDSAHFTNNASYRVDWLSNALAADAFFNAASGTVTQAIGAASWTLTSSYVIGKDSVATAAVTHTSGTLAVTNPAGTARLVVGQGGRGTYNLAGGELLVDSLFVTNGNQSIFNFSGGKLRARNMRVQNGSAFVIGTGASPVTFEALIGGTNNFINGLTIQPKGLITGNGTISANVSLSGAIAPGTSIGKINFTGGVFNSLPGSTNFFELNKAAATNDTLACTSLINHNGALVVTNLAGTLTNGDKFQLYIGPGYAGGFSSLSLPALAPGLSWKNTTRVDGSLEVVVTPARDFGVDVSRFQGNGGVSQTSWNQMFAAGKRFVFIRATVGLTEQDVAMSNNVTRATAAGILAGVYHHAHPELQPTTNGAVQEADFLLSAAGSFIGPGFLRPVLVLESGTAMTTTELTDWVIAFCDRIVAQRGSGAAPIIYTLQSIANNELDSRLADYDLWIRAVSGGVIPEADDPPAQGFFTNALGVFNNWSFWQYSDVGSSGGISPLDLDVCHGEYKPLNSYLIPGAPPAPIQLIGSMILTNGAFQFSFTNTPGALFSVLTATNITLPLSNWSVLGAVTEVSPGQFQFTESSTTNQPQRYFRVRSP